MHTELHNNRYVAFLLCALALIETTTVVLCGLDCHMHNDVLFSTYTISHTRYNNFSASRINYNISSSTRTTEYNIVYPSNAYECDQSPYAFNSYKALATLSPRNPPYVKPCNYYTNHYYSQLCAIKRSSFEKQHLIYVLPFLLVIIIIYIYIFSNINTLFLLVSTLFVSCSSQVPLYGNNFTGYDNYGWSHYMGVGPITCTDYRDCVVNCYGLGACDYAVVIGPLDAVLTINCNSDAIADTEQGYSCVRLTAHAENSTQLYINIFNENYSVY